ncbi:MAG TPA: hypothetical protein V6C65_30230, partial [Allocoleopsis sp.]
PIELDLHIEQLILHGFAPGDRQVIASALQQELTRLFHEQGIPPSMQRGGEIPQLEGGQFQVVAGTPPQAIGTQIAQSIYGGLNQ